MLHVANNLFFGRTADGSTRILKLNCPPDEWPKMGYCFPSNTILDVTIPSSQWDSLIAGLNGEIDYEAIDFGLLYIPRKTP